MEPPIQDKALILRELIIRLASYYDITDKEASKLVMDVIHSLEAQALVLQKLSNSPEDPGYKFALASIMTVVSRLHASHLEHCLKNLTHLNGLSDSLRKHNIKQFIAFLNSLHM